MFVRKRLLVATLPGCVLLSSSLASYWNHLRIGSCVPWCLSTIAQITQDVEVAERLRALYTVVDNVELFVGCLAEDHVKPDPARPAAPVPMVGPLLRHGIKEQFDVLRTGDRFWFENPWMWTDEDRRVLREFSTIGKMLQRQQPAAFPDKIHDPRHHPACRAAGITDTADVPEISAFITLQHWYGKQCGRVGR